MEDKKDLQKSKKSLKIVAIITLIVLLVIAGIILFLKKHNNIESEKEDTKIETTKEKEETSKSTTLKIYKDKNDIYCLYNSVNTELAFEIPLESQEGKVYEIVSNYVFYSDNGIKTYNIETKEIKNIMEDKYDRYTFLEYGIIYSNIETVKNEDNIEEEQIKETGFYNIKNDKKMYEGPARYFDIIDEQYIQITYIDYTNNSIENYLQSLDNEEKILGPIGIYENFGIIKNGEKKYITVSHGSAGNATFDLYTTSKKLITKEILNDALSFDKDGNIIIKVETTTTKYDSEGNVINTK